MSFSSLPFRPTLSQLALDRRKRGRRVSPLTWFLCELAAACTAIACITAWVALRPSRRAGDREALSASPSAVIDGDPAVGAQLFAMTCATCHGVDGRGMPQQGVPLKGSAFIAHTADAALVSFLRTGRPPGDPRTLTGRLMPARGGNRDFTDQDLGDIVRYLRTFETVAVAGH